MEIFAKKSLGQHFLHDVSAIKAICDAGNVAKDDRILEIGPGTGMLTAELLARGAIVIACEIDERSIEVLQTKFAEAIENKKLFIFNHDVQQDLTPEIQKLLTNDYKLIANIPYYITGLIIRLFLEATIQPNTIVLLIQKEVAERVIAKDGKESLLSLSVKVFGVPKLIKTVKAGAFTPPPKVDSAILQISNISRKNFSNKKQEENFFTLIKAGFSQKRKTIKNNIQDVLDGKPFSKLLSLGISPQERAENISLDKWIDISE